MQYQNREQRLTRRADAWERGLSPLARVHAWFDLLFIDHGLLRLCYRNRHRVSARLWRSAQPTPGYLKQLRRKGLKSVVCVRSGRAFGSWPLEKEACEQLHLDLHKVAIRARQAPRTRAHKARARPQMAAKRTLIVAGSKSANDPKRKLDCALGIGATLAVKIPKRGNNGSV